MLTKLLTKRAEVLFGAIANKATRISLIHTLTEFIEDGSMRQRFLG
jgi:hypothetical protein